MADGILDSRLLCDPCAVEPQVELRPVNGNARLDARAGVEVDFGEADQALGRSLVGGAGPELGAGLSTNGRPAVR